MNNSENKTQWRNWMAVCMLAIASFIVVSTELAPIGMLSAIASSMGQNSGTTGLVVTLYAWLGAVAALVSVTTFSHLPRKPVVIVLMLLMAASNGIAAISEHFSVLLIARLAGAVAHGAFWAMAGTMGAQLVSDKYTGRATAIIFSGVSIASILGVPFINWISSTIGWRLSFLLLGVLAIMTAIILAFTLPAVSGTSRMGRKQFSAVLQIKQLRQVYLIATAAIIAHFAAFTYIEVFMAEEMAISANWIAVCLFVFGIAGVAGNLLCGLFIDRYLKNILGAGLVLICGSLILLSAVLSHNPIMLMVLVFAWGLGVAILFVGIQAWVIRLAGNDNALPASAIYAAIFNGAVGIG
ncbi:MAG: MFS transporter, partial [Snodgrassella alvi]